MSQAAATRGSEPTGAAGMARGVVEFLRGVRSEMGKVTWPTREELTQATKMIVLLAVLLGLGIGLLDLLLNLVLVDGVAALTR